jgi:hypothetical protein
MERPLLSLVEATQGLVALGCCSMVLQKKRTISLILLRERGLDSALIVVNACLGRQSGKTIRHQVAQEGRLKIYFQLSLHSHKL